MNEDTRIANTELLDALVRELGEVHGDDLVAVVLYGSSAVDGLADDYSDLNVLVLCRALPVERVRVFSPAIAAWDDAGYAPPQLMTVAEWQSAADVFPMEYSDILESHRLLYGTLPTGVERVAPDHLRLELEREAAGKLIQLRRGLLSAGGDPELELQLLLHAMGTFMAIARALSRFHGEVPPRDHASVARRAGELAGFDPGAFLRILEHRSGRRAVQEEELDDLVRGYVAGAARLAWHVDALHRPAGTTGG